MHHRIHRFIIVILVSMISFHSFISHAATANEQASNMDRKTALTEWMRMFEQNDQWEEIYAYYKTHVQPPLKDYPALDHWIQKAMNQAKNKQIEPRKMVKLIHEGIMVFHYYEIMAVLRNIPELLRSGQASIAQGLLDVSLRMFHHAFAANIQALDQQFRTNMLQHLETILFPSVQQSLKNQNPKQFKLYAEMIDLALIKRFVVQIHQYFDDLEKSDQTNDAYTLQAALLAFLPIHAKAKLVHPKQADFTFHLFNARSQDVSVLVLKKELAYMITLQIQHAFDQVMLNLTEKDDEAAFKHAAEALFYIQSLQLPVQNLLKNEDYAVIEQHADAYYNLVHRLVREEDPQQFKKISTHAFQVMHILTKMKGIYLKAGESNIRIDGEWIEFEHPLSYQDPESGETWVSIRAIAEALGMEITYQPEHKCLKLNTGSLVVVIENNLSYAQLIDQEKRKSVIQFEHPLTYKGGHAYIFIKDLGKLLDQRIVWYKDEIIIL